MTPERIAELERLCEAAEIKEGDPRGPVEMYAATVAFVATARTALPEALAEIKRMQERLDAYHQEARYQFDGALDAIRRVTEKERSQS